ncbi:dTDP-4-dehydrorhamnose reductase [soil metagenome]
MKVLITGSNGLLGQKLINLLGTYKDLEVIATSRGANKIPLEASNIYYHTLDVTKPDEVNSLISVHSPEIIIHTAAMTDVDKCEVHKEDCWKLNVEATGNIVEAAARINCFLIHLSTDFIYDGENGPYHEDDIPNPVNFYGKSKLAAEKVVTEGKLNWAIVRTVLVYGQAPGLKRSNLILWVKNNLENNRFIPLVDDQWRTPTLAEDLAMGCYLIAKGKHKGVFNISGKELLTPYQMAIQTARYFHLNCKYIQKVNASTFSQTATRPPRTGFNIDKAREVLGFQPHSFSEGIAILSQQLEEVNDLS